MDYNLEHKTVSNVNLHNHKGIAQSSEQLPRTDNAGRTFFDQCICCKFRGASKGGTKWWLCNKTRLLVTSNDIKTFQMLKQGMISACASVEKVLPQSFDALAVNTFTSDADA